MSYTQRNLFPNENVFFEIYLPKTIVYRKAHGLEVGYVLLFLKGVKRRFNRSHVTKVSAKTFARCKRLQKTYSAGKNFTFIDFLILLTENILH